MFCRILSFTTKTSFSQWVLGSQPDFGYNTVSSYKTNVPSESATSYLPVFPLTLTDWLSVPDFNTISNKFFYFVSLGMQAVDRKVISWNGALQKFLLFFAFGPSKNWTVDLMCFKVTAELTLQADSMQYD